jgi:hypothetical protein
VYTEPSLDPYIVRPAHGTITSHHLTCHSPEPVSECKNQTHHNIITLGKHIKHRHLQSPPVSLRLRSQALRIQRYSQRRPHIWKLDTSPTQHTQAHKSILPLFSKCTTEPIT